MQLRILLKEDDNMAISEQWLPIIAEGISWVKEGFGPSKKELKIQISALEKQVQNLTLGNSALTNNLELIVQEILNKLKADGSYTVNADAIILIGENTGIVNVPKPTISNSLISNDVISKKRVTEFEISKIFDGLDEEIAHSRTTKPSERR